MWQATYVAERLGAVRPGLEVILVSQDTSADKDLSKPISEIGGKGAFAKEIQQVVMGGSADIAVHSAKDLQAETPEGLFLGAFCARGDARDCLVGSTLDDLGEGAPVGPGSARRRVQLLNSRPDLNVVGLRGNIATRLSRASEMDAIVMAAVALERLDIDPGIVDLLSPEQMVPQVGQGALAIECAESNELVRELLAEIDHGAFSGLTNDEIEQRMPGELAARAADKFNWRFPDGESYADADRRAGAVLAGLAELPARRPLLVTHQMFGRALERNLLGLQPNDTLELSILHGTIVRLNPATGNRAVLSG